MNSPGHSLQLDLLLSLCIDIVTIGPFSRDVHPVFCPQSTRQIQAVSELHHFLSHTQLQDMNVLMLSLFGDLNSVLASNRDENKDRPSLSAHFWADNQDVLGGRDLLQHGTWLALSKKGKMGILTNFWITTANRGADNSTDVPVRSPFFLFPFFLFLFLFLFLFSLSVRLKTSSFPLNMIATAVTS